MVKGAEMNNLFDQAKEYFLDHQVAIYALLTALALVFVVTVLL